jgi:streptomycin 6-kinase
VWLCLRCGRGPPGVRSSRWSVGHRVTMIAMERSARWDAPASVMESWAAAHGRREAEAWLVDARQRARSCAETWRLEVEGFLPGGSLSVVLGCRRADGSPAVLKLLAPWAVDAIAHEALALSAWDGRGVVQLLETTSDGRALLLRRVTPGYSFAPTGVDAHDCEQVAAVLSALIKVPPPTGLPELSEALRARFARARVAASRNTGVTMQALNDAEAGAARLARSAPLRGSVHGDAQNKNLLVDGTRGGLVAIDPEPAAGDLHFDAALWAVTHRPGEGVDERCAVLAGLLGLDGDRLWAWCLELAVAEAALDVPDRAAAQRRFLATAGRAS